MLKDVRQITIVGTGLLGGSIGMALRDRGFAGRVVGVGRNAQTLERARQLGCVDEVCHDLGSALPGCGLVILATPLKAFAGLFQEIAQADHEGLIVTDVGSTKRQVCDDAIRVLPDPRRFVGSHPMAGGERHGPDHARGDLFEGKPCIVTPAQDAHELAVGRVEQLWRSLGMRLVQMTPQEHDRAVAAISHLPHVVAVLLVELAEKRNTLQIASTGFGDTTRIAAGDPGLWADIFTLNRGRGG